MGIPLLAELERLINERGSAAILREKVSLLGAHIAMLDARIAHLQQENDQLRKAVQDMPTPAHRADPADQCEERRGALFKRRPGGGYHDAVYCPTCKRSTAAFPPGEEFVCEPCRWFSSFTERQLASVRSELLG